MKIKSANYFRQKYHTDIRGFKEGMGHRTKRILRIERKEYQTY